MATIRQVAAIAGVSPSTVSIVLRGESALRNISRQTQEKVFAAAEELGYSTEKRKSTFSPGGIIVGLFWSTGYSFKLLPRFMSSMQAEIQAQPRSCDLLFRPFELGTLHTIQESLRICDAAIVFNATNSDIQYLRTLPYSLPLVVYNQSPHDFCTVNLDNEAIGALPARIFASRRHRRTILSTYPSHPSEQLIMSIRESSFLNEAMACGLSIQRIVCNPTISGGYEAGQLICAMQPLPDCVFCLSDTLAIGLLRVCRQKGIGVPEDMEIISIGDGDVEVAQSIVPSLSVVQMPIEKVSAACFSQVIGQLDGSIHPPSDVLIPVTYVCRESCGQPQ